LTPRFGPFELAAPFGRLLGAALAGNCCFQPSHDLFENGAHARGVAPEVVAAVPGRRTDIDARCGIVARHTDHDIVPEPEHERTLGEFDGTRSIGRIGRRGLREWLQFQFGQGLKNDIEGVPGRTRHLQGTQIRISGCLERCVSLSVVRNRVITFSALRRRGIEARGIDGVGRHIGNHRIVAACHPSHGGQCKQPERHGKRTDDARRPLPSRNPDIEPRNKRHENGENGAHKRRARQVHGDRRRQRQNPVQKERRCQQHHAKQGKTARPARHQGRWLAGGILYSGRDHGHALVFMLPGLEIRRSQ